jgi:hypothetical protein
MAEQKQKHILTLSVPSHQPLISIPFEENGQAMVRYFPSEEAADAALPESTTQAALNVIGAWGDLDWDEMIEALDRIRHESKPAPPI